jgi:putative membrane protein
MIPRIFALAVVAMTAAGGLFAQTANVDVSPPTEDEMQMAMTTPQAFADRAASSNMFEIMSSELALEKSQSQDVIALAQKMIDDHQAAGEKMKVAAAAEGVTPTATLMPDHQAQLDNLTASAPESFDAAYLGAQLAAHNEAVSLFQGYASQGPDGQLKDFATATLPVLQGHLADVEPLSEI